MQCTADKHEIRYFCQNPATHKFERVFPESEIADDELVVPMFWGGQLGYVTVPGTEFYGPVPEKDI
jgi:pyruvate-formate lyase-activating enzyme